MEEVDGILGRIWERDAKIHYETEREKTVGHRDMEQGVVSGREHLLLASV